jgi:hypothetical protein
MLKNNLFRNVYKSVSAFTVSFLRKFCRRTNKLSHITFILRRTLANFQASAKGYPHARGKGETLASRLPAIQCCNQKRMCNAVLDVQRASYIGTSKTFHFTRITRDIRSLARGQRAWTSVHTYCCSAQSNRYSTEKESRLHLPDDPQGDIGRPQTCTRRRLNVTSSRRRLSAAISRTVRHCPSTTGTAGSWPKIHQSRPETRTNDISCMKNAR